MGRLGYRRAIAVVIVAMAVCTALRVPFSESGPLYLLPIVFAGLWLGRWEGLATGIVGGLLSTLTGETTHLIEAATPVRIAIYGGIGWTVGALAASRERLTREIGRRDLELEELRTIQLALAPPRPPARPALELATCYLPAEQGVAGDFFLVAPAPDGATVVAIGDVAGRGLEAAKRAWYVRTLLAASAELTPDPAALLERANRSLVEGAGYASPFVTVACVLFHPSGRVQWALAGHDQPISLLDGHSLTGEGSPGLPLGVAPSLGCETSHADLSVNGGLLLYTDGLTEARRSNGSDGIELFGEQRIRAALERLGSSSPAAVIERLQEEVRTFSGGHLADDLCLVAVRSTQTEAN
jgi:serine phosphatase RsbU (regulator of sigma subunit)